MKEIREKFSHCKNHQIDVEDQFAASPAYEVYPKKKSLWLSRRYQMLYINFRWRSLIPQIVTKLVAIIISTIPLALKVQFEWTITVTFRAPFDPLEIVITFQYQQITLLVTNRWMETISAKNLWRTILFLLVTIFHLKDNKQIFDLQLNLFCLQRYCTLYTI